jgi:HAD superfamily hydrolase (TIGR01490 family)
MEKTLVVFDFDGTLTFKDSMLEIAKFHQGVFRFLLGMLLLSPFLILYKIGIIPNWKAKEYFLTHFFGELSTLEFKSLCDDFSLEKIPTLLRPKGFQKLKDYQINGDEVIIVSASAENWLSAWCKKNGIPFIGTRLKIQNEKITGKLNGKNCYGPEKVTRLKEAINLELYKEIIVYGDSRGDLELIKIATSHFYKPFQD